MHQAVVDSSVAVKWVIEEEGSDLARSLSGYDLYAPDLLLCECANILWKKVRIGDLTRRQARGSLDDLRLAPVMITPSRELMPEAIEIAFDLNHPVYDCVYLALAKQRKAPLITADERLARAVLRASPRTPQVMLLSSLRT